MRISQGHFQVGMSHQLPHGIHIFPGHDQLAGKIVAHVMPAEILYLSSFHKIGPGFLDVVPDLPFQPSKYQHGSFVKLLFPVIQNSQGNVIQR